MPSPVTSPDPPNARLRFDPFELDEAEARLTCAGEPLALSPRPFALLCALARKPHMLVTKDDLLDAVWGHRFVSDSVLKSAISEVRAVLQDDPKQPCYIETVRGRGYRFIAAALGTPSRGAAAVGANARFEPRHSVQAALTMLCRGDAEVADLIRAVAAALERERFSSEVLGGTECFS